MVRVYLWLQFMKSDLLMRACGRINSNASVGVGKESSYLQLKQFPAKDIFALPFQNQTFRPGFSAAAAASSWRAYQISGAKWIWLFTLLARAVLRFRGRLAYLETRSSTHAALCSKNAGGGSISENVFSEHIAEMSCKYFCGLETWNISLLYRYL